MKCLVPRLYSATGSALTSTEVPVPARQDSSGTGGRVASAILSFLHLRPDLKASIRLACLSHLNTNPDGSPIVSCLAVDTASQTPTRGGVEDRGPQLLHGRARFWVEGGTKMRELVYDSRSGTLTVPGYQATLQGWKRGFFKYVMSLPDEEMIKHVSTSPEHENAEFIPGNTCPRFQAALYSALRVVHSGIIDKPPRTRSPEGGTRLNHVIRAVLSVAACVSCVATAGTRLAR